MYPGYAIVCKVCHLQVIEALQHPRVDLFQVGVGDVQVPQLWQAPEGVGGQVPDPAAVDLEQLEPAETGDARQAEDLGVLHAKHLQPFQKVHRVCRQGL